MKYAAAVSAWVETGFKEAAENFNSRPSAENWNALSDWMMRRQMWANLSPEGRDTFAQTLAEKHPLGQWDGLLLEEARSVHARAEVALSHRKGKS
jgi:hypothetical protein